MLPENPNQYCWRDILSGKDKNLLIKQDIEIQFIIPFQMDDI